MIDVGGFPEAGIPECGGADSPLGWLQTVGEGLVGALITDEAQEGRASQTLSVQD